MYDRKSYLPINSSGHDSEIHPSTNTLWQRPTFTGWTEIVGNNPRA